MKNDVRYLYDVARFEDKYTESKAGCYEWKAAKQQGGYGMFNLHGKGIPAHRASYLLAHGEIPQGYEIDHICQNKACVRVDHLRALTVSEHVEVTKLNRRNKKGKAK